MFRQAMSITSFLAAIITTDQVLAASYLFADMHGIGQELAYDKAKPVIADNGSIAFLNIVDYATDERITVVDAFGNATVLLDSQGTLRPLNIIGPGISDDGAYVAYMARQDVSSGFPIDRIYRQSAGGSLAVLIAEPGNISAGLPGDPVGAVSCRGSCKVSQANATIGGGGSVLFSTLKPTTLSYGNGGVLQTFEAGGAIGFHDEFHQSGLGFKFAVLESGGEQRVMAGLFSLDHGVEWANTEGKYSEFRSPGINDLINTAIIAERDLGGEEILAFLGTAGINSQFSTWATTDGPFASFQDLSLGDGKHVVFLATLDDPDAGKSLYAGPDPVLNRVVGPGDVLFNKTVLAVDLAPSDAVNQKGQIALAVRFTDGTSRVVRASPFSGLFVQEAVALLSTLNSNESQSMSAQVDVPDGIFDLTFELDFLRGDGLLEVLFGGSTLGRFTPAFDGLAAITGIDPAKLFGSTRPDAALLEFRLSGGPGVSVHLDNVSIPGFFSDGFDEGYLDGWRTRANGGVVTLATTRPDPIPLPAGAWLLCGALALLGTGWRRRGSG